MKTRIFTLLILLFASLAFASGAVAQVKIVAVEGSQDAFEPSTNGEFAVSLTKETNVTVTVIYEVLVSSTATPDADYVALSSPLEIPPSPQETAVFMLPVIVIDDNEIEADETVTVRLLSADKGFTIDPLNEEATVNIISDDVGLTLLKTVENDEGGTAVPTDFTLMASGPDVISGVQGDAAITNAVVHVVYPAGVGIYTLTETPLEGYTNAGWVCTGGQTNGADGTVTLVSPDIATCTVTNTDDTPVAESGTLTLLKVVENDEGGTAVDTDFTLTATGPVDTISGVEGAAAVTNASVGVGTYALSESGPAGYTEAGWSCDNGENSGSVTLADTDVVTCTVTNTDDTPTVGAVTLNKAANTSTYSAVDDVIFYTYTVTSTGAPVVGPITVADDKVTVTCPGLDTIGNFDDKLDLDEELTCTASYEVVADDITAGFVTNTATASGNDGGTVSEEATVTVDYLPPGTPLLTLVKTAVPESFIRAGQLINYSYLVSSIGNAPVIGPITVTDSRMTVDCPDVDTVGNGDDNLDEGESMICTSSLVTTMDDTANGRIITTSVASGLNVSSLPDVISVPYAPLAIPTLSEWSMILLSFLFLMVGMTYVRRRQVV
jgi:hypothetical protein